MSSARSRHAGAFLIAAVVALAAAPWLAGAAAAQDAAETEDVLYPLTFPVIGDTYFSDTFGACRDGCTRTHEGIDIMGYGWKGLPVVAAHDGVITLTTESAGRDCCAIWRLEADDGWKTAYLHLNNDTPDTDDGCGWGFAPGIDVGVGVHAGQLIGWVGDSGNAESVSPHLHFELRRPDDTPVNPFPSLLAASRDLNPRISGPNRFDTAAAISRAAFPSGAETVFIATGYNYPDALAAGPAATTVGAPVLLTEAESVPAVTLEEIDRLGATKAVVLGGEGVAAQSVIATLESRVSEVVRLWGHDRFGTAASVSREFFRTSTDVVYIANGLWFPGAVAGAPAAAADGAPLLLTISNAIPAETIAELERLQPSVIVLVGGTGIISGLVEVRLRPYADSIVRIPGSGVYDTAAAVASHSHPAGASRVYVSRGDLFPDALAGISVAYRDRAPILLTGGSLPSETATAIEGLGATDAVILGGTGAVTAAVDAELWQIFNDNDMPLWR